MDGDDQELTEHPGSSAMCTCAEKTEKNSSDNESEQESESETDSDESEDSEEEDVIQSSDDSNPKPCRKIRTSACSARASNRKRSAIMDVCYLSPELSSLVGSHRLTRCEVMKRVWTIIKDRKLYDPKDKRFTLCDKDLYKVFKVKRFRTFNLMKLLKGHFLE